MSKTGADYRGGVPADPYATSSPTADLARFFRPRLVAVVGASQTEGRPTTINWRLTRRWADRQGARIVPVNPNRESIDGLPTVATLLDLAEPPDVVAVLVSDAEAAVRDAVAVQAGFVVVFAAGYAEAGPEGLVAQQALAELVVGSVTRLIGPNTNLNAFEQFRTDLTGPALALISQSGHQGRPLFMMQQNGVRVDYWAPTGNEADLESADFIEWFAEQPEVGCIAAYIEGFARADRFVGAARHALKHETPLALVKVGRSASGRQAASTHTGKLAGSDRVADAVFRQLGVVRVDTLDELADTAQTLARAKRPHSDGVVVYSISGGTNAHTADLCAVAGLRLATFQPETLAELRQQIPGYLSVNNPVDCGGHPVGDERGRKILNAIIGDPDVGALICVIASPFVPLSDRLAADLAALAEDTDKLVAVVWGSPVGTEEALRITLLGSSRLVVFRSVGNATKAVAAWLRWHQTPRDLPVVSPARNLPAVHAPVDETTLQALLSAVNIAAPRTEVVANAQEAVVSATTMNAPVVVKVSSPRISHRSDLDMVRLNLFDEQAVRAAATDIMERAQKHLGDDSAQLIVAEQIGDGVEMIVGAIRDAEYGLVLMVGLGGVFVEILEDVVFRLPTLDRQGVRAMIDELRGAALLRGGRGRAAVDVEALIDAVLAVQRLALGLGPSLRSLELNPLLVRRGANAGAVALDALIDMGESTMTSEHSSGQGRI